MEPKVLLINKLFNKGSYKHNPGDHEHDRKGVGDTGEEAVEQNRGSRHQNKCWPAGCKVQEAHTCACGDYTCIRELRININMALLIMGCGILTFKEVHKYC